MTESAPKFVSGFVSLLGRPNAGKSTLLNTLVGARIAIVASKPQTTRTSIQGVLTLPEGQIVFLDTPGIHQPDSLINQRMMENVRAALADPDLLLFVIDAAAPVTRLDRQAVELLRGRAPAIAVFNKIDRLRPKSALLPLIDQYRSLHEFAGYFPISALTGEGVAELRAEILARLPEGPPYFPPDHITDQPERFLAAELIREQVIRAASQEVPHAVAVLVDAWEESPRLLRIAATIYVERAGQKAIIIGARGAMLKRTASAARLEMEALFGRKVFLEVFVKVRPGWRENREFLGVLDWRSMAGIEVE